MGQKAITIFTPSGASAHISAEDDAFVHRCMLGADSGIIGSLSCVKVDDNTVRLSGGGVSNHGYIMWIPEGETLELSVDAGVAGYNRIDTVASVFTRGGGDVADTHTLTVIKGKAMSTRLRYSISTSVEPRLRPSRAPLLFCQQLPPLPLSSSSSPRRPTLPPAICGYGERVES